MPQNLSIGYTTFCAEACAVVVKTTNTKKLMVMKNDRWNLWMSGNKWISRLQSDAVFCGVWSGSTLYAQDFLSEYLGWKW